MTSPPVLITKDEIGPLLSNIETFMFDCDGVIWRDNKALPAVPKFIEHLRNMGKKIFFITNNNTKSRRQYLEKFSRLEIDAKEEEIYSSAYAAVYYIKHIANINGKVYVLGTPGLVEELDKEGISHIGYGPDSSTIEDWDKDEDPCLDSEVACVLHGFDGYYSYKKMKKAANYVAKESVLFIATNKDLRVPTGNGVIVPGSGCMVVATEAAANRKALIAGKPETLMMDCIVKEHGIDPKKACVVGDNIHTDIPFGNRSGSSTILVLSGVSTLADVEREQKQATNERNVNIPDYYTESLTTFYDLIMSTS